MCDGDTGPRIVRSASPARLLRVDDRDHNHRHLSEGSNTRRWSLCEAGADKLIGAMEFFCYHRDRPGSFALREELIEKHWAYMDGFAKEMIARGPTLSSDGETPTGSVHVIELPGPEAARAFAFNEPYYQAGVYRDVLLRRWRNTLGRTMWDFRGGRTGGRRFLVLGLGLNRVTDVSGATDRDELIASGPLLSDDGGTQLGMAVLVRAHDPIEAGAVLDTDAYSGIEVHNWEFGGRT